MTYHDPALLDESIHGLNIRKHGIYVDATFGGGGHAKTIVTKLGADGLLIGIDQDPEAARNSLNTDKFKFCPGNFRFLKRYLKFFAVNKVDGILADLGVSSYQFDTAHRGFSYRFDAKLDMRMNNSHGKTAEDVLNTYTEQDLIRIFSNYGEVRNARTLARIVVQERVKKAIVQIGQFSELLEQCSRGNKIKYLSQVFQALRIEVNDEIGALEEFLQQSMGLLKTGGRLVIISYHSIEDRIVKRFMKTGSVYGEIQQDDFGKIYRPFKLITKKPVIPQKDEIQNNPRARSAKLRVAERLAD